jgi:hypothetical protein
MTDNHKKALWPWIVALLIGLPVLYVASFGPACWVVEQSALPRAEITLIYSPLIRAAWSLRPNPFSKGLRKYAMICDGFGGLAALGEDLGRM